MMQIPFNAVNNKECHLLLVSGQFDGLSAVSLTGISSMCLVQHFPDSHFLF